MSGCCAVPRPLQCDGSFQYQSVGQSPPANIDTEDLNVHFVPCASASSADRPDVPVSHRDMLRRNGTDLGQQPNQGVLQRLASCRELTDTHHTTGSNSKPTTISKSRPGPNHNWHVVLLKASLPRVRDRGGGLTFAPTPPLSITPLHHSHIEVIIWPLTEGL
ncbi:hypothetical protein MHYP_G00316960 [Metynnis hypsauchen]